MTASNTPTYEAIFEACEEGILVVDDIGLIVLANKSAKKLFGYEDEEMNGVSIDMLVPTPLRKIHVHHRANYHKNPHPRVMGKGRDLLAVKKSGEEFPVEVSLNQAILNGKYHTVAFIINISERKLIEEALRKSEEQLIVYATELENRVSERTKELDKTIAQLEKANIDLNEQVEVRKKAEEDARIALEKERELNELKSRFVSMASHEFRTPLSTILSSASLIAKYNEPGTTEKRLSHVEKIKSSISNLNNILNDFLSLAKLEEGKIELTTCEFEVVELAKTVMGEMEPLLKSGQKIQFSKNIESLMIKSDNKLLKNIIINLMSNAIKYSDENKTITFNLKADNHKLVFEIIDKGMGIPEQEQKHLFERFFRAKNATNIQGTGLGLNIVKKYIEMLSGSINFISKVNEGTTFIVTLPL